MKTILSLIAAVAVLSGSVPASARSLMHSYSQAKLTHFDIDPRLVAARNAVSGTIVYDHTMNTLNLTLLRTTGCKPGMLCPMMVPAPYVVELHIESMDVDACGSVTYVAREDHRPVDGGLSVLTLVDHSENRCAHTRILPGTELVLETASHTRGGESFETRSFFTGGALKVMPRSFSGR
jgi:hypothetical protein